MLKIVVCLLTTYMILTIKHQGSIWADRKETVVGVQVGGGGGAGRNHSLEEAL